MPKLVNENIDPKKEQELEAKRKAAAERMKKDEAAIEEIRKKGLKTCEELKMQELIANARSNQNTIELDGSVYSFTPEEAQQAKKTQKNVSNVSDGFFQASIGLQGSISAQISNISNTLFAMQTQFGAFGNGSNKSLLESYNTLSKIGETLATEVQTPKKYQQELGETATVYHVLQAYYKENMPNYAKTMDEDFQALESVYGIKVDLSAAKKKQEEIQNQKLAEKEKEKADWAKERQQAYEAREARDKIHRAKPSDNASELQKAREQMRKSNKTVQMNHAAAGALTGLLDSIDVKTGRFGRKKNLSLRTLYSLTNNFINDCNGVHSEGLSDEERIEGLFKIRNEAMRFSSKKPEAQNILDAVNGQLYRPENMKIIEQLETKHSTDNDLNDWVILDEPKAQANLKFVENVESAIKKNVNELNNLDLNHEDTKKGFEDKKAALAKALAKTIAGSMLRSFAEKATGIKEKEVPTKAEAEKIINEQAEELLNRSDFQHMMNDVIDKKDMEAMKMKGISGKRMIDELARHGKMLAKEEKHAEKQKKAEVKIQKQADVPQK